MMTNDTPATTPTIQDDHDRLLTLVVTYGAARFQGGYRLATAHPEATETAIQGDAALHQIATLITQLQRKAGGGL